MKFASGAIALFLSVLLLSSTLADSPIIRKRVTSNETTVFRRRLGCDIETAILQTLQSILPTDRPRLHYAYYCESRAPPPVRPTPPTPTPPPVTPPNTSNTTNSTTPPKRPGKGKDAMMGVFVGGAATIATSVLYLLY